ncbi:MAG: hypothetical protein JNN30_04640 [Rhodanobacteraceae bacterium]|nr:hypothetical protein [Rhodanobacteraceae bacterium]
MRLHIFCLISALSPTLALAQAGPLDEPLLEPVVSYVTIVNMRDGHAITNYGDVHNGELYLFNPYEYRNHGSAMNFRIVYADPGHNQHQTVWFQTWDTNRLFCIASDSNSFIHTTANCGSTFTYWYILPTSTGAVQLKNYESQRCLSNPEPNSSWSFIHTDLCVEAGGWVNPDQLWMITAQRGPAVAR